MTCYEGIKHELCGIVDQDQSQSIVYRMVGRQFPGGAIQLFDYSQDVSHVFILGWNLGSLDLFASIQTR